MTGIERYMRILRLFDEQSPSWTVAEITEALDTSSSTLYRLVRELVSAGFLESTVDARYRLGPAIVEYERRMRLTDPLILSGSVFLEPLAAQVGIPCTTVLVRLYGDTVMCVADAPTGKLSIDTSFERGRPMPLFRGATSLAILAGLEGRRLRRLLKENSGLEAEAKDDLLHRLADIRRTGYSVTRGEVDTGAIGLAVPVVNRHLGIHASLSVIAAQSDVSERVQRHILALINGNARMIETFMAERAADAAGHAGMQA